MAEELQGRVALVTGGGGGLGEAVCRTLATAGATLVATDIRPDLADQLAGQLREQGAQAMALRLDVGDEGQADQAVRQVVERYDRLDILVNNAGTDVTVPLEELSFADWDRVIRTNLRGPFVLSKCAFPVMKRRGRGHIVNVVSTAAKRAWANATAYHASKWGLLGLSHALHVEGRKHNIKVTAVVSGGMRTPFILDRFPDVDPGVLQDDPLRAHAAGGDRHPRGDGPAHAGDVVAVRLV